MDDTTWDDFRGRLAGYLATMTDREEQDHLLLEMPGDCEAGCAPYAQVAAFGGGEMLRVEMSGNRYLAPAFELGFPERVLMDLAGWQGGSEEEPNYFQELPVSSASEAADAVVRAFRRFHLLHPGLLTFRAWGPAAEAVDVGQRLGLTATDEVVEEAAPALGFPDGPGQLTAWVRQTLQERLGEEPTVDDDGDYVLDCMGEPVWVCVRHGSPAVEIMARVVHGVRSRRHSAVEVGLLNRDHSWIKWVVRDRDVWQSLLVPGRPFSGELLNAMIDTFFAAMDGTRDDLALRTSGRVA